MNRDSIFYKIRRKCQVFAHIIMPDEVMCKFYSRILLKKNINLKKPQTFNEKIQWLKIHDYPNNPLVIQCADKYRVRKYLEEKGLEKILVPLIGHWDDPDKINWDELPQRFVLKYNHGCAYNIICNDKTKLDKNSTIKQLRKWMKEDFGAFNIEPHYSKIKPHITCEKFLGDCIMDYKFFCFNGEPKYIYVSTDLIHDRQAQIGFFYLDGNKMPMIRTDYTDIQSVTLPSFFRKMLEEAKILCEDFSFVRVDFFVTKDSYYFAELTFTPSGGMMPFNPDKYDLEWGQMIRIGELEKKYGKK
ncbi:ATP-grasp fold amidoligase family protein [Enterococcus faecium]|uniref:ATP-grasp fold amidoligase family protein n=1 Tax=Enterococcus faecium TaxID=1352 RepID=UPI00202D0A36|nr:ATP-grasp fold amidoligase family protein [Enterococcus faecium]MCL9978141.1 glycosyl transferase [Enterococcus faecium]MDQ8304526.1 ATP-grasp fold amidoligase family protein [Enterococcus faecium]MDQ8428526.1 ATP-grasp fold amidoligase family protein [Enterococcus faecium]